MQPVLLQRSVVLPKFFYCVVGKWIISKLLSMELWPHLHIWKHQKFSMERDFIRQPWLCSTFEDKFNLDVHKIPPTYKVNDKQYKWDLLPLFRKNHFHIAYENWRWKKNIRNIYLISNDINIPKNSRILNGCAAIHNWGIFSTEFLFDIRGQMLIYV